ncbi:CHAT domain-containing protein [Engelhardtia mirabilis]|uniref:CHAT domain protein n=1 Tax=Engelhardtia mirabilis TaxID=2528011 RepID=A0A518BSA9_9BACT|nr:CHAT domain protein [Planctomycetes bacterium Pla133]QDV04182.1 CHAT domain protein [Planctomycetes bacterium Pla86]
MIAELERALQGDPSAGLVGSPVELAWAFARLVGAVALDHPSALPQSDLDRLLARAVEVTVDDPATHAWVAGVRIELLLRRERWAAVLEIGWPLLDDEQVDPTYRAPIAVGVAVAARAAGSLAEADRACERAAELLAERPGSLPQLELSLGLQRCAIARLRGLMDVSARHWAALALIAADSGDAGLLAQVAEERANFLLAAQQHDRLDDHVRALLEQPDTAQFPATASALRLVQAISLGVRGAQDSDSQERSMALLVQVEEDPATRPTDRRLARLRLATAQARQGRLDLATRSLESVRASADGPLPRSDEAQCARLEAHLGRRLATSPAELLGVLERTDAAFDRFLEALTSDPPRPGGLGFLQFEEHRGFVGELIELLLAVHGPERGADLALDRIHRLQATGSRARLAGYVPGTVEELRGTLLAEGQGQLIYLPTAVQTHLLTVDAAGTRHHRLPPIGRLHELRARFQQAFAPDRAARAWTAQAARLREALLPQDALERLLEWRAVTVIGLDLVRYVPFELLPLEGGELLGEVLDLGYLPSLSTGMRLARRPARPDRGGRLALVVAPTFDDPLLEAIPLDDAVLERLLGGATDPLVLSADEAGLAGLAAAELEQRDLLTIVTHGRFDRLRELSSGLALAAGPDGPSTLWPEDVPTIAPLPPVVVVAACKAARSAARMGEGGLDGLIGALIDGGASCVVVAHEDVEYAALLELLEVLQPRLLTGEVSVARALAEAQQALRARRPETPAAALLHAYGLVHRVR